MHTPLSAFYRPTDPGCGARAVRSYAGREGIGMQSSLEVSSVGREHAHRGHGARSFMRTSTRLHFRCATQLSSAPRLRAQFSAYRDVDAGVYDLDEGAFCIRAGSFLSHTLSPSTLPRPFLLIPSRTPSAHVHRTFPPSRILGACPLTPLLLICALDISLCASRALAVLAILATSRGPCAVREARPSPTSTATASSISITRGRGAHHAQHPSTSIAPLLTTARPQPTRSSTRTTPRGPSPAPPHPQHSPGGSAVHADQGPTAARARPLRGILGVLACVGRRERSCGAGVSLRLRGSGGVLRGGRGDRASRARACRDGAPAFVDAPSPLRARPVPSVPLPLPPLLFRPSSTSTFVSCGAPSGDPHAAAAAAAGLVSPGAPRPALLLSTWSAQMSAIALAGILIRLREGGWLSRLFAGRLRASGRFRFSTHLHPCALYPAPPPPLSVIVRRSPDGLRADESAHTPTDELARISLRVSLLLPLSPCELYRHELDASMPHPRDCRVRSAAPRCPGAVRRRRDVAVPRDDFYFYFFRLFFIAVMFFWDA
ncbi:hypothetical protein B0H17DRAFT_1336820 [Mycena rosella]|uniref:Uncharacterized protein n=1 Tax=Mycena rosella TaxID=1033263 RepID=A0AAD7G6A5_MYCRO|nr:hypothetical protein B0H17DRAFT_1336820 [Mycena rosella]